MKFTQLVRTIDTNEYYEKMIDPKILKAQYNPERFQLWMSLHNGPKKRLLNMIYSPHYRFLKDNNDKSYHELQRLYGRKSRWIDNKVEKFLGVFSSIKNDGFKESIMILEKPLVSNKYNDGFEIFEGHHRVACCLILGIQEIPCQVIRKRHHD